MKTMPMHEKTQTPPRPETRRELVRNPGPRRQGPGRPPQEPPILRPIFTDWAAF